MTRNQAIKLARDRVTKITKLSEGYSFSFQHVRGPFTSSIPRDYRLAQIDRAQKMIDIACELLGIEDYPQYYGGDWTNYIPKKK